MTNAFDTVQEILRLLNEQIKALTNIVEEQKVEIEMMQRRIDMLEERE